MNPDKTVLENGVLVGKRDIILGENIPG